MGKPRRHTHGGGQESRDSDRGQDPLGHRKRREVDHRSIYSLVQGLLRLDPACPTFPFVDEGYGKV